MLACNIRDNQEEWAWLCWHQYLGQSGGVGVAMLASISGTIRRSRRGYVGMQYLGQSGGVGVAMLASISGTIRRSRRGYVGM